MWWQNGTEEDQQSGLSKQETIGCGGAYVQPFMTCDDDVYTVIEMGTVEERCDAIQTLVESRF